MRAEGGGGAGRGGEWWHALDEFGELVSKGGREDPDLRHGRSATVRATTAGVTGGVGGGAGGIRNDKIKLRGGGEDPDVVEDDEVEERGVAPEKAVDPR